MKKQPLQEIEMKNILSRGLRFCVENGSMLKGLVISLAVLILLSPGCATQKATSDNKRESGETNAAVSKDSQNDEIGAVERQNATRVSEFILGTGDELQITVFRKDELSQAVRIEPSGKIMYPLTGDIQAAGLSIFQLRDKIREGLSKYIVNPQVVVSIVSVRSQKIIVLGEVGRPGFFQPETSVNTLEAISQAGGFTQDSEERNVLLIRGGMEKPELRKLDLQKALKEGDLSDNALLQSGDIVYVPNTFISDVSRFFEHLAVIIRPVVEIERGYLFGDEIINGRGGSVMAK